MSVVRPRQFACFSTKWTSVVLFALYSTALGAVRVDGNENGRWLCTGPGCIDGVDPSYQGVVSRIRRTIDDNDISQNADTVSWKPGDLSIVSDKLSVFQDSDGDYKAVEEVKVESDNADGALESAYTIDLKSQGSENVANEQKIDYSYPYVVFRKIGDGKKVAGNEDAIYKDGTSYVVFGNSDEHSEHHGGRKSEKANLHSASGKTESKEMSRSILDEFFRSITLTPYEEATPDKRSSVDETSNAIKIALAIAKELFTNSNEMRKNIGSIPREPTNSGTFLSGLFRDYQSPVSGYWSPWGWQGAYEPSEDISNFDRLLASMISDMLEDAVARKPSRPSSGSSWCPFTERGPLSAAHPSAGLVPPELLWLVTML